jgi:hypothetical protein
VRATPGSIELALKHCSTSLLSSRSASRASGRSLVFSPPDHRGIATPGDAEDIAFLEARRRSSE